MANTFIRFHLVIVTLVCYQQATAQCPRSGAFMKAITEIESTDNNQADSEKINALLKLQHVFIAECDGTDSVYARILHRIGQLYQSNGDIQKGIDYTREAIAINSSNKINTSRTFLANSYFNLGLYYSQLYLFSESTRYFDSCIYLGLQFPEKAAIVLMAYEKKAFTSYQSADFQNSMEISEQGISLSRKIGDSLHLATLLLQQVQSQIALNDTTEAERHAKEALRILRSTPAADENLANAFHIYAALLAIKNQVNKSIKFYNKAFHLNNKLRSFVQAARNLTDLGLLYTRDHKRSDKAISCYKLGITAIQKSNDAYTLTGLYINTGVVYWAKNDFKEALGYYQRALNALLPHFTDSSIHSNPSRNVLREIPNNYDYYVSTLLSNKGDAFLDWYKNSKKEEHLHDALNAYEAADMAIDLMRWKQFGENSKLFWRTKTKSMYENAIETCYNLNNPAKAFYFFEKSRAALLNDKLSELGAKKFLSIADRNKEQELYIKTISLKNQLFLTEGNQNTSANIRQQLFAAQGELDKFIRNVEKRNPIYYQYKYDNTVFQLHEVKERLNAARQSMLTFFSGDSIVYILYVSQAKTILSKLPFKSYGTFSRELLELCSDKGLLNHHYQRYSYLARTLYDTLLKPLNIPNGRVIISSDEHFIPFELLLSDATANSFLLKKYAFSYTYSARFLFRRSPENGRGESSFLGIAPINYNPDYQLSPLKGAESSLQRIRSHFKSAQLLLGKDATRRGFMSNLSIYKIIQLYSHAEADSTGEEPRLYLSDSAINLSEIQLLDNLEAEMIVLSACKTTIGKNASGEGMFSLARAFYSVGIPCTVSSFWQVEDETTFSLTELFYKFLNMGFTKDEALQKAKLESIKANDSNSELPNVWAPFIIVGNTDPLQFKKAGTYHKALLLEITLVIVLLALTTACLNVKNFRKR